MASKWKKRLKKVAKIGLPVLAAVAAAKLGKKRLGADKLTEGDIGLGQSAPFTHDLESYVPKKIYRHPKAPGSDFMIGPNAMAAKGGRIGAKKGGHVKSMGKATRGGGAAKR